ncbi:hypothetical protein ACM43_26365 [Bradyrhizobium sp. CCBAU 45321]|nr:hypothetical protein [Bradyrhizobium sp. CCBAU 45321]
MIMPIRASLKHVFVGKRAGRLECALVGAGDLGGIAPGVVVEQKGSLLVTTLLQPTGFLLGEFLG